MRALWTALSVCLCCLAMLGKSIEVPQIPTDTAVDEYQQAAVATVNNFGRRIYQALSVKRGSFVSSPLSAVMLSLLWGGSGGRTAHELGGLLQLPDDFSAVQIGFYSLLRELQGLENTPTIEIAQRIYLQDGTHVLPEFRAAAKNFFMLGVHEMNFATDPDGSRKAINNWVAEKTRYKINDPVRPGMIDTTTKLFLVSAVYLKARWASMFQPEQTTMERFHMNLVSSQEVPMMHTQHVFRYTAVQELDCNMLELPLETPGLTMLILLPMGYGGVRRMESKMHIFSTVDAIRSLVPFTVNVALPKFHVENTIMMNEVLEELGMSSMFHYNANFSGVAKQAVRTSQILQKVRLEVNEQGTEAASFRAGDLNETVMLDEPVINFRANHPFVFMLHESVTSTVLFIGRYLGP